MEEVLEERIEEFNGRNWNRILWRWQAFKDWISGNGVKGKQTLIKNVFQKVSKH